MRDARRDESTRLSRWALAGLSLLIVSGEPTSAAPVGAEPIRQAIRKSLSFIEKDGVKWMEKKGCVSCHHTAFLIWSHREAAQAGFKIDGKKLEEWTEWAFTEQLEEHEKGGPIGERNIEGLAQLILGQQDAKPSDEQRRMFDRFAKLMMSKQEKDGTWKAGGQLPSQKRPKPETEEVSTMWACLAMNELADFAHEVGESRDRAAKVIAQSELKATSTEWHVLRLLMATSIEKREVPRWIDALLARQNKDGGWSWVGDDPSDALATGQALFGLAQAGLNSEHAAIQKSWRFLIETQRDDGSWRVLSTKESKKEKALPTSVFWGAAWATMGLLEGLPEEGAGR